MIFLSTALGIRKQPFGGDFVTAQVKLYLEQAHIKVTPQYLVKSKIGVESGQPPKAVLASRPNTSPSYHEEAVNVMQKNLSSILSFFYTFL